jgi:hypothetical protein
MAYNEIQPAKKTSVVGGDYIPCDESEATHWIIEVGWDGNEGVLILPSKKSAYACMEFLVHPYECGEI